MAYITLAELKTYLGIGTTADDTLLTDLIDAAKQAIDTFTHRTFETPAGDPTLRFFDADRDTDREVLFLDDDAVGITVIDNGGTVVTIPADVIPIPRNKTPITRLRILCDESWCFTDCPEDAIEVTATWAYSTTAPEDIKQATKRLSGFYYRQKDSMVFDSISVVEAGVITVPAGMPAGVKIILDPYVKLAAM